MKKSFEYDLTKYDPNAPTRTEQFLTADGAKTLTTDANDGAVLIQDSVDPDSLNPVTAAAVASAVAGASGEVPVIGDGDNGKVLKAVVDGSDKHVEWGDDQSGSSYTAGNGISITQPNNRIGVRAATESGIHVSASGIAVNTGDGISLKDDAVSFAGPNPELLGDGLKLDNKYIPVPDNQFPDVMCYYGFRCNQDIISWGTDISIIDLDASNGEIYSDSEPSGNIYPYFYMRSDHTKYVTSTTSLSYTYTNDYGLYRIHLDRITDKHLTIDTSHAGSDFDPTMLTTDDWALGFVYGSFSGVPSGPGDAGYWFWVHTDDWEIDILAGRVVYYYAPTHKYVSVTRPIPWYRPGFDVGKVLTLTQDGLAWEAAPGGAACVEVTTSNTFAEVEAIITSGKIPYIKEGSLASQYICYLAQYIPNSTIGFAGLEYSTTDLKLLNIEIDATSGWGSLRTPSITFDHA